MSFRRRAATASLCVMAAFLAGSFAWAGEIGKYGAWNVTRVVPDGVEVCQMMEMAPSDKDVFIDIMIPVRTPQKISLNLISPLQRMGGHKGEEVAVMNTMNAKDHESAVFRLQDDGFFASMDLSVKEFDALDNIAGSGELWSWSIDVPSARIASKVVNLEGFGAAAGAVKQCLARTKAIP